MGPRVHLRGRQRERFDFGRRDSNVMTVAEIGAKRPLVTERWEVPATGRSKEQFFSGASRRNEACQHLDFSPVRLISDFWPSDL